jgi:ribonuclease III
MSAFLQTIITLLESKENRSFRRTIRNLIGLRPKNLALYRLALTHRSAAVEMESGAKLSNERLEYLGDAILGAVVANMLFKKFPLEEEGFLTQARSKIVSRKNLNSLSLKLGLPDLMEKNVTGNRITSIPGDALEALVGAIFLDRGYNVTETFIISSLVGIHLNLDAILAAEDNYKSQLIEWCQKEKLAFEFEVVEEADKQSRTRFTVQVIVDGQSAGKGLGRSKKSAEQDAAKQACAKLIQRE